METGDGKADVTEALAALEKDIALDGTSHACSCTDIARALAGSGCAVVGAVACVRTPEDEGGKLALAPRRDTRSSATGTTSAASSQRRRAGPACSSA